MGYMACWSILKICSIYSRDTGWQVEYSHETLVNAVKYAAVNLST